MNGSEAQPVLRPLGLGEVLDRAVSLCVKYFVVFSTIWLVFAIPLAVVSYYATRDFQTMLQSLSGAIQHGAVAGKPASPAEISRALAGGGGFNVWSAALIFATILVAPLPSAALIEATASAYLGRLPTFGASYRAGVGRWLPLVGVNLLYIIAGAILYVLVVIIGVLIVFALAFLTATLHAAGIAIDVVVGLGIMLLGLAFGIIVTLAWQVSFFTCVIERASTLDAFTRGISRVFAGVGLKRSLLIGVAYLAVGIAVEILALVGDSILAGLLRSDIAGTAYMTILSIATAAFTTAFIGIFYFDLRVREEGLDLTLAAQSARAVQTSPI